MRSGVIVHEYRPVSQWMIIKMGLSTCAVVPITFPLWNAMFLCYRTRTRQSTGRNKNPTDDVMPVTAVLWVALRVGMLIEPSNNSSYRYVTTKIQFISNTSWCSKTSSRGPPGYYPILSRCSFFAGPARSRTFINHSSRLQTLHKTINYWFMYLICPATLLLLKPACDMRIACHLPAKVDFRPTII
jgi:hypothetical protein